MQNHKLEISRMPGLTRLRCEPCGFYAAIIDSEIEAKTDSAIRQTARAHLNLVKCTCSADPKDPLAFSLAEQAEREKRCPVHGAEKYQPLPEALVMPFTAGFSELRGETPKDQEDESND
jgi:hypothetical protein